TSAADAHALHAGTALAPCRSLAPLTALGALSPTAAPGPPSALARRLGGGRTRRDAELIGRGTPSRRCERGVGPLVLPHRGPGQTPPEQHLAVRPSRSERRSGRNLCSLAAARAGRSSFGLSRRTLLARRGFGRRRSALVARRGLDGVPGGLRR